MVNWGILGSVVLGVIISSIFFFSSFGFVDENNAFTLGGFALFIGGIGGYVACIYVLVRGLE